MTTAPQEENEGGKSLARKTRWLPMLEQALKARVGWVDEAISPFTRRIRAEKDKPKIPRAA